MRLQSLKPVFFAIALAVSSLGGFKAAYSQTTPHSVEPYAPSADDIVLLMTNDQADRYAETLYNDVMSTDPTKKTVVSFAHFTDEGRAINPMLERAITTVERKLYFIGQSHRLVVERHVIAKDEFEDYVRKKLSEAGEFNQLHYRVKYKEELGVDPTPEMTRLAEDMVKPASVWKRMKQSVGNLFGIRGGLTIRAHYSYPVNASAHAVRKKRTEHTWKYRLKLGAITASIAAASFSGVVAGPVGFLDFMGPTHLGSTAALAGWVLTCLYNFDRIQLFKNQGRTLEVDPTKKGDEPNSVAIGTSRKTYAGLTIIQESVINALITAILLGPSAMFGPEWATIWGVFVLANAVTGGLAYLPFESYSAGLNDRSASLRSEGEAAQKRGEIHL